MSKIDTSMVRDTAFEGRLVLTRKVSGRQSEGEQITVARRGALPAAPLAMPMQTLEWSQRSLSRLLLTSLAVRRRPVRAGR